MTDAVAMPEGFGSKGKKWWEKLSDADKAIFLALAPRAQQWLIEYTRSIPGPSREPLARLAHTGAPIQRLFWSILRDKDKIFFPTTPLPFQIGIVYLKTLEFFETTVVRVEGVIEDSIVAVPDKPIPSVKYGTKVREYGTNLPPGATLSGKAPVSKSEPNELILALILEVQIYLVGVGTEEESLPWIKEILRSKTLDEKLSRLAAQRLLELEPGKATLSFLEKFHPKIGQEVKKLYGNKRFTTELMNELERACL